MKNFTYSKDEFTKIGNYIDGEFCDAIGGESFATIDPATMQSIGSVPNSVSEDIERAMQAARRALPLWRAMPVRERSSWLRRLADAITTHSAAFALAECRDNGKPLSVAASVDIPRAAYNFEFFADAITQFSSDCFVSDSVAINHTVNSPLGIVGCISPWNLPLYLLTWKIAPALAAGNTVVAKPSEVTPLTAYLLSRLCDEIGFPKGVLNIVHGLGSSAGAALVAHSDVNAISFTGSTVTGRAIALAAASTFKKVSLEMGGKNPFIVFEDANLNLAVETAVRAAFSNQGQICLCGSRFLVHESIYKKFTTMFVEATQKLRVGEPMHPQTNIGALVSQQQFEKVVSYVALAKKEGGKILCGGAPVTLDGRCRNGLFFAPTIVEGLGMDASTNQDEIFGPVVSCMPFKSETEAIALANNSRYGLSATVMTENVHRAQRVAEALEVGIVWVNTWMLRDLRTPFGGVKESGVGREGGIDALKFMTETKNICSARN